MRGQRTSYDPWVAVDRRSDVILAMTPVAAIMGGAFTARRDGRTVIAIDPALGDGERRAALTHELVHDERGGLHDAPDAPALWSAVVCREERAVEHEVARRLAPSDAVRLLARELAASNGGVTARELAAELELPERLARLALEQLADA